MVNHIKNFKILPLIILLSFPFSFAVANGDCNTKNCAVIDIEEHKTKKVIKQIKPKPEKCITPRHKKKHRRRVKRHIPRVVEIIETKISIPHPVKPFCKTDCEPEELVNCERFPDKVINCGIINPSDIVDFTCSDFPKKLKNCEPYACQAPYVLDPSFNTQWQILGKTTGGRCIVANTTEGMGIKDENGKLIPITQTCEYDEIGTKGLIRRFKDMQRGYYHFSTCEHYYGIHNCTFKSLGKSIEAAIKGE